MAPRRTHNDDDLPDESGDGQYCDLCHQEYTGHCPIRSSRCPFEGGESDGEGDEASGDGEDDGDDR